MNSNESRIDFTKPLGERYNWVVMCGISGCLGVVEWDKYNHNYHFYPHDLKPLDYKSLREIANFCEHETFKRLERRKVISNKIRSKYK